MTPTILHVDDNEINRYRRTSYLREAGLAVVEASSASEALASAETQAIDMILLDIRLPDLNGFEVCRRLKESPTTASVPVLLISALGLEQQDYPEALGHGADAYLKEPVDASVLLACVGSLLRAKKAERDRDRLVRDLEQERNRLRFVIEATNTGIWRADADGHFTEPLPDWEAYTGQRWPEYSGGGCFNAVHPDERTRIQEDWQRAVREGRKCDNVCLMWHAPSKGYRHVAIRGNPVRASDGRITEWLGTLNDIDEHKRILLAQEESHALFRTLTDNAPIGFAFLDTEGRCRFVNKKLAEINGFSAEEHSGRMMEELLPSIAEEARQLMRRVEETGEPVIDHEVSGETPKAPGEIRYWSESCYPVRTSTGRLVGFGAVVIDTTERRRAMEALLEGEQRFNRAMLGASGIVYEWDKRSGFVYRSPGLYELIGVRPEEAEPTAEWWFDRIHPDDQTSLEEYGAPGSGRLTGEYRVRHQDGRWIWVWDRALVFHDENSEITRVVGSTVDISERKAAEAELHHSRRLLSTMAETVPEILFTNRPDGTCDYVSQLFCRYTGMAPDAALGSGWARAMHPEDHDRAYAKWQQCINAGVLYEDEYRLRKHDGSYRWFRARAVPLQNDGEIVEWFGVASDVHELKEAQEELERRTRALEASNDELLQFGYVLSHDLQAPLRTIGSMTAILAKRHQQYMEGDSGELVAHIKSAVQRASRLIADLLEYARLSEESRPQERIHSGDMATWAVADLQAQIEESKAVVTIEALPEVMADHQLARVFQNLIGNSIKYRGQARPEIRISAERSGGDWTFAVRDNGIGFDMKFVGRIFGVFKRLHGPAQYEGSGVGLAICKKIVEGYGGRLWAESAPAAGATFYFTVPACAGEIATAEASSSD